MPWINTIRTLYLAFYSKHVYIRAAREWRGIGFGYLFVLILLSTLCIGLWVHTWTNVFISKVETLVLPQLPKMTFADGHLTIDKELPYLITVNDTVICRFDKTDVLPADPVEFSPLVVGETKTANYVRGRGMVKEFVYDKLLKLVIEPLEVAKQIKFLKTWLGLIVAAILLPIHFFWVALQTLIMGCIGRVFTGTMNFILSYGKLVRVSVVAVTPGVLLGTLLIVTNQFFALWIGIYGIMAAVYLFFGVYSNKHANDFFFYEDIAVDDGFPETTEFE